MAPKNKKKNSFYFFMKEMKDREAARGVNISMQNMAQIAHPVWARLSLVEKEPYEEMARQYKNDPSLRGGKLASDGTRVEDNIREAEDEVRRDNEMKQDVKRYCNIEGISKDEFIEFASHKLFYFLSFNILCHTEEDIYIPIEVGLVEYSIQNGIHRVYHKILHPGHIPTGYAGEAKRLSEEKHQIDIFGKDSDERNMKVIYDDILTFTKALERDECRPVFCLDTNLDTTRGCLDWLARASRSKNVFDVWNSVYLLMELRAGAGPEATMPSVCVASDLLHKTCFDYHPDARCQFHEEKDVHFCALAYSKCLCYLFSDALCLTFDVTLTENHIPKRFLEEKGYSVTAARNPILYAGNATWKNERAIRLDKRSNYYENEIDDDDSEDSRSVVSTNSSIPRQPASSCLAEEMSRLRLNITTATVPGHGIGRGQRRK